MHTVAIEKGARSQRIRETCTGRRGFAKESDLQLVVERKIRGGTPQRSTTANPGSSNRLSVDRKVCREDQRKMGRKGGLR